MTLNKLLLLIILTSIVLLSCKSKQNTVAEKTNIEAKAGYFTYKTNIRKHNNEETFNAGYLTIYPETDGSLLFYLEVSIGAPSYNSGRTYGRLNPIPHKSSVFEYDSEGCNWQITFKNNSITIHSKNDDSNINCSFGGHNVSAFGDYKKEGNTKPSYFSNYQDEKIYFNKTKPEDYNNY